MLGGRSQRCRKIVTLAELAYRYAAMPYGGRPLRLSRVANGGGRAFWSVDDGMQSYARWPVKRRALWTLHAAGWQRGEDGFYRPTLDR